MDDPVFVEAMVLGLACCADSLVLGVTCAALGAWLQYRREERARREEARRG